MEDPIIADNMCACADLQEGSAASDPTIYAPSPLVVDQSNWSGWFVSGRNRGKVCKEQSGNEESDRQSARPTTRDRARQEKKKRPSFSEQDRRVRCLEARTPRVVGQQVMS